MTKLKRKDIRAGVSSLHAAIVEYAASAGAKFWDFSQAFKIH